MVSRVNVCPGLDDRDSVLGEIADDIKYLHLIIKHGLAYTLAVSAGMPVQSDVVMPRFEQLTQPDPLHGLLQGTPPHAEFYEK